MFYLKYRPKTIAEIDNSRVSGLLKKILKGDDLPHAFLFVGQKGTGKTSAARIFAKAVNCTENKFAKKGSDFEPCNKCSHCLSIDTSTFTDVVEMDAASNRGIEEVKNLIRETAFLPMSGRFRVFIIDEAHMITPDGFNALLKTLEEPSPSTIFILATTNMEKLPKTIISRCIKINFGKGKIEDIVSMLKRISSAEKFKYSDEILKLIAYHSEASFRDAAKIIEEVSMQKILNKSELESFLGIRGKSDLLEIITKKDVKNIYLWIEEFSQNGGNFKNLIEDILEELRVQLLMKKGVLTDEAKPINLTVGEISRLIKLLMESYQQMRITPIESLPLEIALNEFYNGN
jgi:DNA polymerase-3 subunit gamma/tau